jgi:hypothetical protein
MPAIPATYVPLHLLCLEFGKQAIVHQGFLQSFYLDQLVELLHLALANAGRSAWTFLIMPLVLLVTKVLPPSLFGEMQK